MGGKGNGYTPIPVTSGNFMNSSWISSKIEKEGRRWDRDGVRFSSDSQSAEGHDLVSIGCVYEVSPEWWSWTSNGNTERKAGNCEDIFSLWQRLRNMESLGWPQGETSPSWFPSQLTSAPLFWNYSTYFIQISQTLVVCFNSTSLSWQTEAMSQEGKWNIVPVETSSNNHYTEILSAYPSPISSSIFFSAICTHSNSTGYFLFTLLLPPIQFHLLNDDLPFLPSFPAALFLLSYFLLHDSGLNVFT